MKNKTKLMLGDNIESLKKLPANSIDSVVTDPPYGLLFMGKKWDYDVPSVDFWKEVYRVLKPGGHIVSFGGTRTYHRMVVNMEDAGFEIRDQIMWIYGSGFPKSHNISKAMDKLDGVDMPKGKGFSSSKDTMTLEPTPRGEECDAMRHKATNSNALQWEGFGTALKPANEPICLARKPLSEKSVAENVLKWRTGGINVDGCRVEGESWGSRPNTNKPKLSSYVGGEYNSEGRFPANIIFECICDEVIKGEIKSNTRIGNYGDKGDIHTNPDCPCRLLDEQSGESKSNKGVRIIEGNENRINPSGWKETNRTSGEVKGFTDKGGASRFFYQAKVSKAERNMGLDGFEEKHRETKFGTIGNTKEEDFVSKNNHPTLKPINLMTYLCRLITPPNGIVLDPFMGSGSTGVAAQLEGFRFVGMEMDEDYFKIAEARIENFEKYTKFTKK